MHKPPSTLLIWDFDDTLAYSEGKFSGTLLKTLNEHEPEHGISLEVIRPFLSEGFPWHKPEEPHPHLANPEDWWAVLEGIFTNAYISLGVNPMRSSELARLARHSYTSPTNFTLFDDTLETLYRCQENGWESVILSNHVPELSDIVQALGLTGYLKQCFSSAVIGYEKPHPEAYRIILKQVGHYDNIWMIGDSLKADVRGAETVGLKAILVRKQPTEDVKYYSPNLSGVIEIIANNS